MLSSTEELVLLQRLPGTGSGGYWRLLDHFPSLHIALRAPLDKLRTLLPDEACSALQEVRDQGENSRWVAQVKADIRWAEDNGVHLLDVDSDHYPSLLREIRRPPPLLYVKGNPGVLSLPQVAVIGSRSPTPTGRATALDFAHELAASGFAVTSGLALGVDVAAHQGALQAGGKTIAVMGTGIDQVYPARHQEIAAQIVASGGALITEFPLGAHPQPANFPQRNRIISGLSCGILVVEAAVKSGSLITARHALQQNREVFAIPGSIHNPLSKGCHALIKDGATLVEAAADIVEELGGLLSLKWQEVKLDREVHPARFAEELATHSDEAIVLAQLGFEPTGLDTLVKRTGLAVGDIMACLLTMELRGLVANMGAGYMRVQQAKPAAVDLSSALK
jgi:DNA processing protein